MGRQGLLSVWSWNEIGWRLLKVPLMLDGFLGMTGAFWFLKTLLLSLVCYAFIDLVFYRINLSRMVGQSFLSVCFLLTSTYSGFVDPYFGLHFFAAYSLIHLGRILRAINLLSYVSYRHGVMSCLILLVGLRVSLGKSVWSMPLFMMLMAVMSFIFLATLSKKIDCSGIGVSTMPILIFHFLAFKIVSIVGVLVYDTEWCFVGVFPVSCQTGVWWLAYSVVGLIGPMFLGEFYRWFMGFVNDR